MHGASGADCGLCSAVLASVAAGMMACIRSAQHRAALVNGDSALCCAEQQVREVLAEVSELKATGAATAEVVGTHGPRAAWLLAFYRRCLAVSGRIDLDDLVPLAASLLHDHPAAKATVSGCAFRPTSRSQVPALKLCALVASTAMD